MKARISEATAGIATLPGRQVKELRRGAALTQAQMARRTACRLRLSAAYDILCSKVVIPRKSDCVLTLDGKQNKIDRADFDQFAGTLRIPSKVVSGILDRFSQGHARMVAGLSQSRLPADMQRMFAG